ncbi:unnamed protein product [Caenorhabditis brenneri]
MIVYFITKLYKLKKIRKDLIVRKVPDIKITNNSSKPLINSQKFKKDPEAIDIRRVQVLRKLETGNYGDIHNGLLEVGNSESEKTQLPILVKRISTSSSEIQKTMLLEELSVMRTVKPHPNVLCLVGVVLLKSQLPYTIFEYVERLSLLDYLRTCEASLDLNSFAYQIANGMKFLASVPIVHRDLSLKNISLTNDKIIKIGGLGLAGFDRDQYYIREITEDAPFSLELLSPEAFEEWEFTEKSDVWAFGVCLFELFSLGKVSYDGVDDIQEFLRNGGRLVKPEYCSQEIYTLMLNCWNFDPVIRPTFSQCVEFFAQILDSIDPQIRPQLDQRLHTALEHQKNLREQAHDNS